MSFDDTVAFLFCLSSDNYSHFQICKEIKRLISILDIELNFWTNDLERERKKRKKINKKEKKKKKKKKRSNHQGIMHNFNRDDIPNYFPQVYFKSTNFSRDEKH